MGCFGSIVKISYSKFAQKASITPIEARIRQKNNDEVGFTNQEMRHRFEKKDNYLLWLALSLENLNIWTRHWIYKEIPPFHPHHWARWAITLWVVTPHWTLKPTNNNTIATVLIAASVTFSVSKNFSRDKKIFSGKIQGDITGPKNVSGIGLFYSIEVIRNGM